MKLMIIIAINLFIIIVNFCNRFDKALPEIFQFCRALLSDPYVESEINIELVDHSFLVLSRRTGSHVAYVGISYPQKKEWKFISTGIVKEIKNKVIITDLEICFYYKTKTSKSKLWSPLAPLTWGFQVGSGLFTPWHPNSY
jgi:hypothetical protein